VKKNEEPAMPQIKGGCGSSKFLQKEIHAYIVKNTYSLDDMLNHARDYTRNLR
jgi:hypothetical protein